MRNSLQFSIILIFFMSLVFSSYANEINNTTAFFITDGGYAVTSYQKIASADSIKGQIGEKEIEFEIVKYDFLNDFAVIKPKENLTVKPIPLYLGDMSEGDKAFVPDINKDLKNILKGNVSSLKGTKGDIRHFKIDLNTKLIVNEGPVFNDMGYCIGLISDRVTDIYSLIQPQEGSSANIVLSKKIDYLFPLLKDVKGVLWKDKDSAESAKRDINKVSESIISLKISGMGEKSYDDTFKEFRSKIPADVLFIYVSLSSGFDNIGFSKILLDELTKNKIGNLIDPALKQKYYKSIFEKYGQSDLSAIELVKMAADLAGGNLMEVSCNIVSGEIEDNVHLKLYEKHSIKLLSDIKVSKLIDSEPKESLNQLVTMAVQKLRDDLIEKKSAIVAEEK